MIKNYIEKLDNLPYFTTSQLSLYFENKNTARVYISRWLKKDKIYNIKKGIYVSAKKFMEISFSGNVTVYKEFIASNLIYIPSYLSMEYVLFENNIITENVYNFTLITTNKTAKFKNNFGNFIYKSIKKDLFGDYEVINNNGLTMNKATPEKALFDYLYFKRGVIFTDLYIKELRLNLENINFNKLEKIIKIYNSKKVNKIFIILKKLRG